MLSDECCYIYRFVSKLWSSAAWYDRRRSILVLELNLATAASATKIFGCVLTFGIERTRQSQDASISANMLRRNSVVLLDRLVANHRTIGLLMNRFQLCEVTTVALV